MSAILADPQGLGSPDRRRRRRIGFPAWGPQPRLPRARPHRGIAGSGAGGTSFPVTITLREIGPAAKAAIPGAQDDGHGGSERWRR